MHGSNGIVLGFTEDQILDLDVENFEHMLIVCEKSETYTLYLLQKLFNKLPLTFYSLKNVCSEGILNKFDILKVEHFLPNILVFDGVSYSLSSRIIAEAFKYSLTLSEEEFLLLHTLLSSLLKQSSKLNLLHIVSSVKSYCSSDSCILERNAALKLEWRLHLIEELFPYIIREEEGNVSKGSIYYNISHVNSFEGKLLTLLLLLSKNFLHDKAGVTIIFLGLCPDYVKAGVVKFIQFFQTIVGPLPIILSCEESFPLGYLSFFETLISDKPFLERCERHLKTFYNKGGFEGELFYVSGDNVIPFFYDAPQLAQTVEEKIQCVSDDFVGNHALVQRILEVIVNYPNVTKQGLVQSLSIDHPTEVIEYVLNELIEKGYVIVEVEKTKTGPFAKLSISMDGRALLSKKKGGDGV